MTADTISLDALRAHISERIRDAGGPLKLSQKLGLTAGAWSNILHDECKRPGPAMLALLGYVEEPPRYRPLKGRKR